MTRCRKNDTMGGMNNKDLAQEAALFLIEKFDEVLENIPDDDDATDAIHETVKEKWVSEWNFPRPHEAPEFFRRMIRELSPRPLVRDYFKGWADG